MAREFVTEDERNFFYSGRKLPKLYLDYMNYLRNVKKLALGTIQNRKSPVLHFLLKFPNQNRPSTISGLTAEQIQEYTIETAHGATRNNKRALVIALRDFFRFLHFEGFTKKDLSECVPTIVTHRHSSLPKGMPWPVVEKLLKVPNRRTFCGKRDYAIILMFSRYGIRAIQLRNLTLSDIDWKNGTIRFAACKGGKDVLVPMFDDVAKALITYLKAGRKEADQKYQQVFLTSGTYGSQVYGQRPLEASTWNIVAKSLKKIETEASTQYKRGPHSIRHAYATKLLDADEPLKTISDLLGHKSLDTTFIYTKSSVEQLRPLSREWPEQISLKD